MLFTGLGKNENCEVSMSSTPNGAHDTVNVTGPSVSVASEAT